MPVYSPTSNRNRQISNLVCMLLSLLFIIAFLLKAGDAPAFRNSIGLIVTGIWPGDGIPEVLRYPGINLITTFVLSWEATLGIALLIPSGHRFGLVASASTLLFFLFALVAILFMPDPPSCGCLGGAGTSSADPKTDAMIGIVRNTALIVLAIWSLRQSTSRSSPTPKETVDPQCP